MTLPEIAMHHGALEILPGHVVSFEGEAEFRHLLERLPVGAYTCDPNGLITFFNSRAVQLWGREPKLNDPVDRFCGSLRLFTLDGAPVAHDRCWMALALKSNAEYFAQEIVVERPDGERVTVLANANPLHDESGRLIGAVNVLVDISDRKLSDDARALLASIVESSNDAIVSKTLDGIILSWNTAAERLFGYTASEAVGRPITLIVPADRLDEETEILARLRRGERIEHFETVRVSKEGRRIDISLCISPIHDIHTGAVIGASKVARDVTERKESRQALLAVKDELAMQLQDLARLQEMSVRLFKTRELQPILGEVLSTAAAINGTDMGLLCLCDEEPRTLAIGASLGLDEEFLAAMLRLSPWSATGKCFRERRRIVIEDIETDPQFELFREPALRAGIRAIHSTPLITRSGEIVGVLTTHFREIHRPSSWEMHLADLCARQAVDFIENARLYAQLRDADRAKNEFLAVLAHELRNPLAPIRNATRILHLAPAASNDSKTALEIIERQMVHMTRLIDDLLDVARITGNKLELRRQPVEVSEVLRLAVETCRPLVDARGLNLTVDEPSETCLIDGDPTRLAQVVSNLLNNASKFTPADGHIWLSAFRQGSQVVITVKDTGVGISPAALPGIFDLFGQGERPTGSAPVGLGIGLTLVKRLVLMHGGSVHVRSDGPGKGSEFEIRLPSLTRRTHVPVEKPTGTSLAGRDQALRVLAVDDDQDSAASMGMLLRRIGHDARVAHDGPAALAEAQAFRPDVVLLDIGLPEVDGHEVARRIRQEPWGEHMLLVAITGWSQKEDRELSELSGFDHHLVKPVEPELLKHLLATRSPRRDAPWGLGASSAS